MFLAFIQPKKTQVQNLVGPYIVFGSHMDGIDFVQLELCVEPNE